MSRLSRAVEVTRLSLEKLSDEQRARTDAALAIDFEEHFAMQRLQSSAFACELLSADEAMIFYIALGEVGSDANGGWAADTDTATKYACSRFAELLIPDVLKAGGLAV
jgi:hypothetical protein